MKFSRQLKRQFAKVAAATVMTVSVISPNGVSAFTYEPTANLSYREVSDKVDSVTDKYAPVYYKTSNYSESDPLYAATHFHIFAQDDVQLNAHTNGNIATNYMSFAGANSGTHGIETELNISEVSYVKDFKSINSQILWNGDSPLVVGPDVTVDTYDNGNGFTLKGSNMDHAESMNNSCVKNIFQETKGGVNYIDIETEFAKLEKLSKGLSKVERTDDETVCDFSDFNNRKVMLDMKKPYMVFDVNAYELSSNTPITLVDYVEQGPESVIINVDLKDYSGSSFDENAHIKYLTVNGESIANKERTTWEYGKVLWNFYDSSEADGCYNGTIKVNGNFLGSILAPGAAVITNQNFDGTAICRTFENHAETHRNDFTGNLPKIDLDSDFDSKTTVATTESSTEATTVATTEMVTSTDTTTTEATTAEETTDKTTEATTAEETTDKTTEATTVEKTTATTTEATTSSTTEVITVEELSTETTSKTAIDDDDSHKQTTTEATSETTTEATSETTTFEEDTTKADSDESTTKADDKEESSESTTSEDTAESSETTSEQTEDTESSESTTEEESTNKEEDTSVEDTTTSGSAIDDDDIDKKTTSESTTESTTETTTQNATESESESSTETTTDSVNETATEATTKNATDDSDGDKETTTKGGQSSSDSDRDDNDNKGDSASESTTETFSEGSTETTTTNGGDSSSDSERPGGGGAAGNGNTESTTSDSDNATETTTTDGDSSTNGHRGGGSSSNKASVTSDEKVEDNTNVDETEDVTDGTSEVEEITEANTEESFDTTVSSNDVTDTDNTTDNSDDVNSIIDNANNNGSVSDNAAAAAAAATAASNSNADKLPQTGSVINTVALFAAGFGAIALGMFLVLKSRKKA